MVKPPGQRYRLARAFSHYLRSYADHILRRARLPPLLRFPIDHDFDQIFKHHSRSVTPILHRGRHPQRLMNAPTPRLNARSTSKVRAQSRYIPSARWTSARGKVVQTSVHSVSRQDRTTDSDPNVAENRARHFDAQCKKSLFLAGDPRIRQNEGGGLCAVTSRRSKAVPSFVLSYLDRRIGGGETVTRYLPIATDLLEHEEFLVTFRAAFACSIHLDRPGRVR